MNREREREYHHEITYLHFFIRHNDENLHFFYSHTYYTRNDDFAESNVFVVVVTLLDDD